MRVMGTQSNKIVQLPRHRKLYNRFPRLTQAGAYGLQVAVVGLLAAGTVQALPFWANLLSGTFWLAFSIYWGAAA